ncbi:hypothetical protein [Klebsiella quasipneumoniae]|uniref:hypothetical protein n=1 Tax=Klebsiella quasipneumoniae TaxID=1463165 RepID=UPI0022E94B78|nr:hypothetical protein [Klebsiella quasipneumoniae]
MVKKISLLGVCVLLVSRVVLAENTSNWIPVASDDTTNYSAKKGTYRNVKGESSLLMMFESRTEKKVTYYKVSIKNADCDNGYGNMFFYTMDGKLAFQGDYVADGNSVGAGMGDFICAVRTAAANAQKS